MGWDGISQLMTIDSSASCASVQYDIETNGMSLMWPGGMCDGQVTRHKR
jgi:hypothetical protein